MEFTNNLLVYFVNVLFLLRFLLCGCDPQFFPSSDSQTALVGSTVDLNCTFVVDSDEEVIVSWGVTWASENTPRLTKCGEPLDTQLSDQSRGIYKSSYIFTNNGADTYHICSLTITDLTQYDAGSYTCTLTLTGNGNSSVSEQEVSGDLVDLSVVQCASEPIYPDGMISLMTLRYGIDFAFTCNVSGGSRNVSWFDSDNNMISVPGSNGNHQQTLRLKDNREMFTCKVRPKQVTSSNIDDDDTVLCHVQPLQLTPQAVIVPIGTAFIMEGASVTLICKGEGSQCVTSYTWFMNDKSIPIDTLNFKIKTMPDLSVSYLTINEVRSELNGSYFSCMIQTKDGEELFDVTELYVLQNIQISSTGQGKGQSDQQMWRWPVGVTLALTILIVSAIFGVIYRRYKKDDVSDMEKGDANLPKQNGSVKGGDDIQRQQSERDMFEHRPSLDFLDISSGRRKSSLFQESFQDLWKGTNMMNDNMSDTSSVSLPSFAVLSKSRPDLATDHDEEFAKENAHPPLSARVSAPASFQFNVNKSDPIDLSSVMTNNTFANDNVVVEREDVHTTSEAADEKVSNSEKQNNDTLHDMKESEKTQSPTDSESGSRTKRTSNLSTLSIPSVQISSPDETDAITGGCR